MRRVVLASLASSEPMGQQLYESAILQALEAPAADWGITVEPWPVRSLRSAQPGRKRLPLSVLHKSSERVQRVLGAVAYPRGALVHRLDLRLPPAPQEVVTVHDLAPLHFSDEGRLPKDVGQVLRRARAVICPSLASARELAELYGLPLPTVIPNGLPDDVWTATGLTNALRAQLGLTGPYVLQCGGASQRKNLASVAGAWSAVQRHAPDLELVLTGPPDGRRDALFARLPGVRILGKVARPVLLDLMHSAAAVLVPSVYEGFGFPALEAMATGTPVIAAARSSLPEVCGEAALLVEPTAEGLAEGVVRVLEDNQLAHQLAVRGPVHARPFTWEASATMHLDVYDSATHVGS